MDLHQVIDWGFDFYLRYPIFCYVVAGVLLVLILWKPAKVLKTAFLLLILLALLYAAFFLINSMNIGVQVKEQGIQKMEKALK